MGCCGSSRQNWRTFVKPGEKPEPGQKHGFTRQYQWPAGREVHGQRATVRMVYHGSGSIVVVGPHTGRRYRFAKDGTILEVDRRDALQMTKLRHLTTVANDGKAD